MDTIAAMLAAVNPSAGSELKALWQEYDRAETEGGLDTLGAGRCLSGLCAWGRVCAVGAPVPRLCRWCACAAHASAAPLPLSLCSQRPGLSRTSTSLTWRCRPQSTRRATGAPARSRSLWPACRVRLSPLAPRAVGPFIVTSRVLPPSSLLLPGRIRSDRISSLLTQVKALRQQLQPEERAAAAPSQ